MKNTVLLLFVSCFLSTPARALTVFEPYWGVIANSQDTGPLAATSTHDEVSFQTPQAFGLRMHIQPDKKGWYWLAGAEGQFLDTGFTSLTEEGSWRGYDAGLTLGFGYAPEKVKTDFRLWLTGIGYHSSTLKTATQQVEFQGYGGKITFGWKPRPPRWEEAPKFSESDNIGEFFADLLFSFFSYNFTWEYRRYSDITGDTASSFTQEEDRVYRFDISLPIGF